MSRELRRAASEILDKWMVCPNPVSPSGELANNAILLANAYMRDHATAPDSEIDDLNEMSEELTEAGSIEGSEVGEWWTALSALWPIVNDGGSPEFERAVKEEIRSEYARLRRDFVRVVHVEQTAIPEKRFVRLEYAPED